MVKHYLPSTLKETLELLNTHDLEIIAGGTDLMVQRRKWANTPPKFKGTINIINLKELNYIHEDEHHVYIGSTTPLSDLLQSELTPKILKKSIYEIASPALRNLATIAGNIGNASPAGDTLPILYLLNAKIKINALYEEATIPIESVILGPRKTILKKDQLITEIIIPKTTFTKTTFVKVGGRKADAISKLSFTAAVHVKDDIVTDIRFAFGAVGPTIVRIKEFESNLINHTVKEVKSKKQTVLDDYSTYIRPIDDQRSNKEYRKKVSLNLLKDFLCNL